MSSSPPPLVLTFAASDPTGGAGLQADVLTLCALDCHPLSVVTAITVQDTSGVQALRAIETHWVVEQARRLLDEMQVAAFKLGVLGSEENVRAIGALIAEHPRARVVLDPVLASGRGDALADDAAARALCESIVPRATVVTPNSIEARRLGGHSELAACAQALLALGAQYVLVTGTHEAGADVVNTLYERSGALRSDRWQRLPGSYHGSGCTLASAIAARLAHGVPVPEAVYEAQRYTWHTLAAGFRPGSGQHLPRRRFK
jgi:hydroxymethylpyrimidine/phosphomethylpyrimidine kinase